MTKYAPVLWVIFQYTKCNWWQTRYFYWYVHGPFLNHSTNNIFTFLCSHVCTSIHISYMFMSLHVHVLYMTNVKITFEFQNVIQNLSISIYECNMIHAISKVNQSTNNWCNLPWQFLLGLFSSWSRLACSLSKTVSFETTMCWWYMLQNQFLYIIYLKLFRVL